MATIDHTAARDSFRNTLVQNGLKITPQRIAVYEALLEARDHPSAEMVYTRVRKTVPNISFDTVYRTLLSLVELGLAKLVDSFDDRRRFEPNVQDHHHCICVKCRKIIDFYSEEYDALQIPKTLGKQFQVLHKRVVLEGICPECRGK